MKRRTVLIGGGGLLAFSAIGFAASESATLLDEPTETIGTLLEPGVYSFNTHGIETVAWREAEGQNAQLAVTYELTPPDHFRLHQPDGKKRWEVLEPSGTGASRQFGLPLRHPGSWELVASQGGDHISLQLPVDLDFEITNYGLRGDLLIADIVNPTDSPNYIDYIRVSPAARGYGEKYELRKRLMPAESYHLEEPYPFDFYKDVELAVVSHNTIPGTRQTKSFV